MGTALGMVRGRRVTPRRILYVTDGFAPFTIGGMQSFARRQMELLAAAGHKIVSISSREGQAPTGLPWRNIPLLWPDRTALKRLSPWRYVHDLKVFSHGVAAVAEEVRPDLIYSEGPLVDALLRRADRPAPILFHPHGLEMFQHKGSVVADLKSWPMRGIFADHARRADRVLCLSERGALMDILTDRIGVAPERIATIPNAAPAETASAPRTGRKGARFLFVGRDEPRKGLPLLLQAMRGLNGAELDVVGSTAPPVPHVRFHGPIGDPGRLKPLYAAADYLVVPSHAEGLPTVILEAFAAALPVIATDAGASAGPVRTGETGWLVPRGAPSALRDAMTAAMALPDADYAALSANCLDAARSRFSAASAGARLLALIDEVTA